jgi:hypothetical protein
MINNLAIDQTTGDLIMTAGQIQQVSGVDAIAQAVYCDLKTFLGEYWLDKEIGVPYYQVVFKKGVDLSLINTLMKSQMLKREDVIEITEYESSLNTSTRKLTIVYSAKTVLGNITNQEIIL